MYTIHKDFTWDMGHRITQHGGKCYSPHGHTYRATVYLDGDLDVQGMVLDFFQLTQIVNPIVEELDHSFLVNENDPIMIPFFSAIDKAREDFEALQKVTTRLPLRTNLMDHVVFEEQLPRPFKFKVVPFESTAENIAKYIYVQVLQSAPNVCRVDVWETPKCCATYETGPVPPRS